ncbi:MAG: P1 family peptidase [Firmicutes bacterium]|nr:P1 family peptidase [Bacillota bacterium]
MRACSKERGSWKGGVDTSEKRPRAREAGLALGRLPPGPLNAITDVPGVLVGHVTLVLGEGPVAARTGVTAIRPHPGNVYRLRPRAALFVFNGYGKSVGLPQLAELGVLETPILLTNTLSVWTAADALVTDALAQNPDIGLTAGTVNPVVGECSDAYLSDIRGRHVKPHHCLEALAQAAGGPVAEGNVGAGTGMSCLGFKGGVGTSSRRVSLAEDRLEFTVGCLVVANFGRLADLRLDGVPVGRELEATGRYGRRGPAATAEEEARVPGGSIMIVLATDAPLSSRQLKRVARRATFGLARTGSVGAHSSGDFVLAFSVADPEPAFPDQPVLTRRVLAEDDRRFGPLFQAAVEATEEAIVNALFKAQTMVGRDGHVRPALPIDEVLEIMRRHGRH